MITTSRSELLQTDLSKFSTGNYVAGPKWKVLSWYFVNYWIFNSSLPWPYGLKVKLLRMFGAKVGNGLVIKTKVRIKNPWRLTLGDNVWIGEDVWIDNLEDVSVGSNACISQGALLLTGNHDYTATNFPYRLGRIDVEEGAWVGAKSVVCPGVRLGSHAILTVNSVATRSIAPWEIHSGNPAAYVRDRVMKK